MRFIKSWPDWLRQQIRTPRLSEEELKQHLVRLQRRLPQPVIWVFGKTQSGKTSIIRTLTGRTDAEIGDGFRPCTRTSRIYRFPEEEACLLQFLDTRGLGESGYDPREDLEQYESEAHLILVTVKAMDLALNPVLEPLERIHKVHPEWPILVVQTTLHEGYPHPEMDHPPYSTDLEDWKEAPELVRSLRQQQQLFSRFTQHFVWVDLTLPEDGFTPESLGEERLWEALETLVPEGVFGMLRSENETRQALSDFYSRRAAPHIWAHALLAGGAGALPLPLAALPLVFAIQFKMVRSIAQLSGQELRRQEVLEVLGGLGAGLALSAGGGELSKLVPAFGSAVGALSGAASTYALGKTFCIWLNYRKRGDRLEKKLLREIYQEQLNEGRQRLREYWEERGS